MKNKQQIISFLKTVTASEKDGLAIESYIARRGIYITFPSGAHHDENTESITFEQFKQWMEEDLQQGDVIVTGKRLGIVREVGVSTLTLSVALEMDTNAISCNLEVSKGTSRKATGEELLKLQRELNAGGLSWSAYRNAAVESFVPADNLQVRLTLLGKKLAVGVFREINEKGEIIMYCMKETGKPARYSLYETVGRASDYQVEAINAVERKKFASELEAAGKTWNGHAKRIEPVNFRAEKGVVYYHINDYLEIIATPDNYRPKDQKRLKAGNYFRTREEAEQMCSVFTEQRNRQLIHHSTTEKEKKQKRKKN